MNSDTDHLAAQEALPWLANGTLAGAELQRVERHLQVCAACREELALLHTVHAAGPGPAPHADLEGALARLLPQLDADLVPLPLPVSGAVPVGLRQRLAANDRSWLRAGVFLQCCVIAVLGFQLARPFGGETAPTGTYHALGAATASAAAGGLVVAFKPDTPERELRRIVLASGARVVGGPTATGAWMLATDQPAAPVLMRLRAEPAVLLAQPLALEGRP